MHSMEESCCNSPSPHLAVLFIVISFSGKGNRTFGSGCHLYHRHSYNYNLYTPLLDSECRIKTKVRLLEGSVSVTWLCVDEEIECIFECSFGHLNE